MPNSVKTSLVDYDTQRVNTERTDLNYANEVFSGEGMPMKGSPEAPNFIHVGGGGCESAGNTDRDRERRFGKLQELHREALKTLSVAHNNRDTSKNFENPAKTLVLDSTEMNKTP